jgi:hypothetical protein
MIAHINGVLMRKVKLIKAWNIPADMSTLSINVENNTSWN